MFDADASLPEGARKWLHWRRTFESYIQRIEGASNQDKLDTLVNSIDTNVYSYISECVEFEDAMTKLNSAYVKPINEVFARYRLSTCQQEAGESLEHFLQRLKILSNDCNFVDLSAAECKKAAILDAFTAGLRSSHIRQRLLEDNQLQLINVFDKARSLHDVRKDAECYSTGGVESIASVSATSIEDDSKINAKDKLPGKCLAIKRETCDYCGGSPHKRTNCPAARCLCYKCNRKGHFAKVGRSGFRNSRTIASFSKGNSDPNIAVLSKTIKSQQDDKVNVYILINGILANELIDTGAKHNHIDSKFSELAGLKDGIIDAEVFLGLAVTGFSVKTKGTCSAAVDFRGRKYDDVNFLILKDLLWVVILGQKFLSQHKSVNIEFGEPESSLKLGALKHVVGIRPVKLFEHLSSNCHPVTTKRRNYSKADQEFICNEVAKLLADDIIEMSSSPWRAQVVVTKSASHKKRLSIDYSQTVNKFTYLDAYPVPTMQSVVKNVSRHCWFSKLDLRSAYHQVPLSSDERKYTAFEAGGQLYQFKRIPFGLKNAVSCFQGW